MAFRLNTPEENRVQLEVMVKAERLPAEDEIVILEDGLIFIDEKNPIEGNDLGKTIGPNPIICG